MAATIIDVPYYDPVIMGNPCYMVIIYFLIFVIVVGCLLFYTEVYTRMKEVWGYRDAAASGKPMAIVRGMSGKIWMETVDYVANVFKSINLPLAWIITAPVNGQIGKVNTIDVSDDWNVVHNVDIGFAIQYSAETYNNKVIKDNPEADREKLDLIVDWETYNTHLMKGDLKELFPKGIILPPFRIIDFREIGRYLPKWKASHFSGYLTQEVEKRMQKKKEDEESAKKMAMWLAAGGLAFLICAVLGYMLLTNPHTVLGGAP
jgi:hypothetical protein